MQEKSSSYSSNSIPDLGSYLSSGKLSENLNWELSPYLEREVPKKHFGYLNAEWQSLKIQGLVQHYKELHNSGKKYQNKIGSMLAYYWGLTDELPNKPPQPTKWTSARLTIPDFDIDVSSVRRNEVLAYIANKYPHSAPIASYSERGLRGATRMVMRALNYTVEDTNIIAKLLPDDGTIDLEPIPERAREVVAGYIGLYGNLTVHPAGILISGPDRPLGGIVPMCWVPSSKQLVAQFNMYSLKKIDMFKLDVLGLSTLDNMARMEELSGASPPKEYDDEEVFALLSRGMVCEVFQLDGYAARSAIRSLGITNFEDIVAINALVRPGASAFIPVYRTGDSTLIDKYPDLDSIIGVTRGLILYQEQVMAIAEILAGFDDLLQDDIKEAIKYFRADVFAALEPAFMEGCAKNGHDGTLIWNAIKAFAGYAFNRAHAVTYAATAYKMAWYKKYHPAAFFAAIYDHAGEPVRAILESLQLGVEWQMPDINHSGFGTSYSSGKITLGLGAIKGIGTAVADAVVSARASNGGHLANLNSVVKRQCNVRHKALLEDAGALGSLGKPGDPSKISELLGFNPVITNSDIATKVTVYETNRIGGFIVSYREHVPKSGGKLDGKKMGFITLVNAAGEFDVTMFPDEWKRFKKAIQGKPSMLPVILYGQNGSRGFVAQGGEWIE